MPLESVTFRLESMMEQITKMLSFIAVDKGSSLHYTFSDDVPEYVVGDPFRLRQIIVNYANNAIKFSNQKPVSIIVNVIKKDTTMVRLKVEVIDNGVGIPEESTMCFLNHFHKLTLQQPVNLAVPVWGWQSPKTSLK